MSAPVVAVVVIVGAGIGFVAFFEAIARADARRVADNRRILADLARPHHSHE